MEKPKLPDLLQNASYLLELAFLEGISIVNEDLSFSYKQESSKASGEKKNKIKNQRTRLQKAHTDRVLNSIQTQPNHVFSSRLTLLISKRATQSLPWEGRELQLMSKPAPCGAPWGWGKELGPGPGSVPCSFPRDGWLGTLLTRLYCNCNSTLLVFSKQKNQDDY